MSAEQSICGWMLRDAEVRPTSTLRSASGTTAGAPADGSGSVTAWAAYQSGSTHTSATQPDRPVGRGGRRHRLGRRTGARTSGGASGRGSWPVVKS